MASYSNDFLLSLLALGESAVHGFTNWGEAANSNFQFLEDGLAEVTDIALVGTNVTLSDAQHRSLVLNLTGTLTANVEVRVADRKGFWIVKNGTAGAYTVTVKTVSGAGVEVPQGFTHLVYSDGTDVLEASAEVEAANIKDANVTAAKLASDAVTTAKVSDDAITLAKMAHGTQGDVLYYSASGAPTRLAKGTAAQVLQMNSSATAPEWSVPALKADGSVPATQDIPMGGNVLTGVGVGNVEISSSPLMALAEKSAILNGHLLSSQENGSNALTGSSNFGACQFIASWISSAGAVSHGRKAAAFSSGDWPFPFMYEATVTTADGSLDAGEYFVPIATMIEAHHLVRFNFGTSAAVPVILPILVEADYTGKAAVFMNNHDGTRSYVTEVDVVADTPAMHFVEIPGDTGGTWNRLKGSKGANIGICAGAGTTYQGTADTWENGRHYGTATTTNAMATLNSRVRGLVLDMWPKLHGLSTDALAALDTADWGWFVPDAAKVERDCQRYWEADDKDVVFTWYGTSLLQALVWFKEQKMLATPTMSFTYTTGSGHTPYEISDKKASVFINSSSTTGVYINTWSANARMAI